MGPYGRVLRTPGARSFTSAGLLGRLPISMIGLGIVLYVTAQGDSYAIAGVVSASFAVAAAIGGPVVSGFVDRHGQHRILPWAVAAYSVFMVALLVALERRMALWIVIPLAIGAGMMMPNLGSLVRARWAYVLPDGIHVAYAWESILDEVVFVVGPPLATLLALQIHPAAGLIACILLVLTGTLWLIPQRRTEPPPHGRAHAGSALRNPGMPVLIAVFIFIGGLFGAFEVVTVAFAEEQGVKGAAGLLLAIYAFGSLLAGFIYGARPSPRFHGRRMVTMLTFMAIVSAGLPLAPSAAFLAPVAFLAGLSVSPVLIAGFALVERIVPAAQLTEGITWTSTGIALGLAVAAPVSGLIIDSAGASTAYVVASACAVTAWLISLAGLRTIDRAEVRALEIIAARAVA